MYVSILSLIIFLIVVSWLLVFIGNEEYKFGNKTAGSVMETVGLVLLIAIFFFAALKGDEINAMNNGTWENRQTFFWKDVDKGKIIEEWQTAQCSKCGKWHTTPYMYSFTEYEYCPHCGSPMHTEARNDTRTD